MGTTKNRFADYISCFFILLFCYAGLSKVMDFENFQVQLAQSPLLSAYAGIISYGVIVTEALICILLAIPKTRIFGIASSFAIMWHSRCTSYWSLNSVTSFPAHVEESWKKWAGRSISYLILFACLQQVLQLSYH